MHVYLIHDACMRLSDYMDNKALTDAAFAEMVGRDRSQVTRWRRGQTRPDWAALARIEEATAGAVTAKDFYRDNEAAA